MKKKKGEKKQADYMEDEDVSNLIFYFCKIFFLSLFIIIIILFYYLIYC